MVDIVPVPDPITGGAGAPVMVANIVNAMWNNAQTKYTDATTRLNAAALVASDAPQINDIALDMSYLPSLPPVLIPTDPNQIVGIYDTEAQALYTLITSNFATFIGQWFPHPEFFDNAINWCNDAIELGGSGINTAQETALFERDRARILADSARAEDEATNLWAQRRWPMPPGALTAQVMDIGLDANRKLAESSRSIMIKSWEAELDNIKFAVKTVIDQRKVALDAAGEYIKTLMLGPQVAMQLATGLADIQTKFAQALTSLYAAENEALKPLVQLHITDAQLKMEVQKANQASLMQSITEQVKAAMQAAITAASMASAGINGVNAQSSVSGSDTTSR